MDLLNAPPAVFDGALGLLAARKNNSFRSLSIKPMNHEHAFQ